MSLVEIRVELPAYALSFVIRIPSTGDVGDIKTEIFNSCVGRPRVDGQRIIWRGRYLLDYEKVSELWSSSEPRIVHLAVHPAAWSSSPPEIPAPAQAPTPTTAFTTSVETPSSPFQGTSQMQSPSNGTPVFRTLHSLAYILYKHQSALSVLSDGEISAQLGELDLTTARALAVQAVKSHGWSWPTMLDDEFPMASEGGLRYKRTTIDGNDFLSLVEPAATPTPLQLHALNVLSYTFVLLSIPVNNTAFMRPPPSQPVPVPPNVNVLLQQLGLPPVRVAPNQNQNPHRNQAAPALREIPLRPLLAPLVLLLFRTLLLLYFVAPARKPVFGVLILAWMLYEIWRPIREGLVRGIREAAGENQRPPPRRNRAARQAEGAQNPQNPQNHPGDAPRPPQEAPGGAAGPNFDLQAEAVLDTFANINIAEEERTLNLGANPDAAEPSLSHKVKTLLSLLLTTIHPAIWNRRRVALRQREGRVRTEANLRDSPAETEGDDDANNNRAQLRNELREQYNRRPRWIREYTERVVAAQWVDDSD